MALTRRTELRRISPKELSHIAQLLNQKAAWKKLMQSVPLEFTDPENLTEEGSLKYKLEHIDLIDKVRNGKMSSEIFLEEWATSGRIRPTLGHLLQLLVKCELFRAADYVAISLLRETAPLRPSIGPAARIDIDLVLQSETNSIQLSDMAYPDTSELLNLNSGPNSYKRNLELFKKVDVPMGQESNPSHDRYTQRNDALNDNNANDIPSILMHRGSDSLRHLSDRNNQLHREANNLPPQEETHQSHISAVSLHNVRDESVESRYIPQLSALNVPLTDLSTLSEYLPNLSFAQSQNTYQSQAGGLHSEGAINVYNHSALNFEPTEEDSSVLSEYLPNLSFAQPQSQTDSEDVIDVHNSSALYGSAEYESNIPQLSALNVELTEDDSSSAFGDYLPNLSFAQSHNTYQPQSDALHSEDAIHLPNFTELVLQRVEDDPKDPENVPNIHQISKQNVKLS